MGMVVFDRDQLGRMMRDFTMLTGIRISFWNATGSKVIYSSESEDSQYCTWLQSVPQLKAACRECDRLLLSEAMRTRRAIRVRCHADLEECASPVLVDGELCGYFMIGQTRTTGAPETRWARLWRDQYRLDDRTTKALYWQLPAISAEAQRAAERMLDVFATSVCTKGYIRRTETALVDAFRNYVHAHLGEPLSLTGVSDALGISRSSLCRHLREDLGTTFTGFVNQQRIALAADMLNRGHSIWEAALASGYSSASYFSKVYRKLTGTCPSRRRQA